MEVKSNYFNSYIVPRLKFEGFKEKQIQEIAKDYGYEKNKNGTYELINNNK